MSNNRKFSNDDETLILNEDEQILLDVESAVPAGKGVFYLTDKRFVFVGKKPLSSGIDMPSGIIGLIFLPIIFILNLISKSKGSDIIEFELPYSSISDHKISKKKNAIEIFFSDDESIEFKMDSDMTENADRILTEQRSL